MRNDWKDRVLAGTVALAMAVVLAGTCSYQQTLLEVQAEEEEHEEEVETLTEAAESVLEGDLEEDSEATEEKSAEEDGFFKEETVYVKADPSGKVTDTTVSEWLKNPGNGKFEDVSSLNEISNVKGEEEFTTGSGDALTWQSEGNDIYYQGTTDQELPVNVGISYKLDGKDISPEELEGKEGKVEIHIEYDNQSKEMVDVDGEQVEMYTPFVMITALMLSVDDYSNITVDNGKIMSDADKNIIVGYALPGLAEDLNLADMEDVDMEIPESVTITADAKNASVGTTITIATTEMMEDLDLEDVNSFGDLADAMDELEDAAGQLVDGSEELADGADTLADGADTLTDGAGTLSSGVNTLNDKSGELISGVNTLASGINSYVAGVGSLASGSASLTEGASALSTGIQSAQDGIAKVKSGADQLVAAYQGSKANPGIVDGVKSISNGLAQLDQTLASQETVSVTLTDEQKSAISQLAYSMASSAADSILTVNPSAFGENEEAKDSYISQLSSGYYSVLVEQFSNTASAAANSSVAATKSAIRENIAPLVSGSASLSSGIEQAYAGTVNLQNGLGELYSGSSSLVKGSKELYSGTTALQQGAAQLDQNSSLLTSGTSQLQSGGAQLKEGVGQLASGATQLADGTVTLADGSHELADGSYELADGVSEFKSEGIDQLAEVFDGDIQKVTARLDAMISLGKEYKSFAGIKDGMNGRTRFVIETVGVEE